MGRALRVCLVAALIVAGAGAPSLIKPITRRHTLPTFSAGQTSCSFAQSSDDFDDDSVDVTGTIWPATCIPLAVAEPTEQARFGFRPLQISPSNSLDQIGRCNS